MLSYGFAIIVVSCGHSLWHCQQIVYFPRVWKLSRITSENMSTDGGQWRYGARRHRVLVFSGTRPHNRHRGGNPLKFGNETFGGNGGGGSRSAAAFQTERQFSTAPLLVVSENRCAARDGTQRFVRFVQPVFILLLTKRKIFHFRAE